MSQSEAITAAQHPERRYEIRRRRVRRRRHPEREVDYQPRDPRMLRTGLWAILAGIVLSVMLICAVGGTSIGTPTVSVYESQSGLSVGNGASSPMRVGILSLFPPGLGTAMPGPGSQADIGYLKGARFIVLIGFSSDICPIHFWVGSVRGT